MAKEKMVWKRVNKTLTPRSYIQYCRSFNCLARYLAPYLRTNLCGFLSQSDRLKQARTIETDRWDLVK